jgi:hypothetical protein
MPPAMIDHALAWAERGFAVFPLREGGKEPALKGSWRDMATRDPDRIRGLWGRREYNVGVDTGDLIVVDIDDKGGKCGSADWELLSYPDDTLTVQTPSGGRHLYYKSGDATGQPALTKSIDIRAAGLGYVVAPGSLIGGKPYTIIKDAPVADAPEPLVLHCQRRRRIERDIHVELDTDEAIDRAIAFLESRAPSVENQNGDLWAYTTACSVIDLGISADMCHELMAEHWNDRCSPPWELEGPASLREKTDSAWRNRILPPGIASFEVEFGDVHIPPVEVKPRRPKFLWLGDKSLDLSQQWLMYNRFPRVGTAAIVGPSNGGKTFLALDLGACLGAGTEWLGQATEERVGTVLLTAEGIGGLPARMAGYDDPGPVVATTVKLIKDNPKEVTATLEEAAELIRAKGVRLGLIVIDTLTASGLLENENDNSEIGRALNYLEQMAMAFQCLVMVTHHPPKVGSGMRGGYALHAGFDVVAEIFQQGNQRFVECSKNRDGPTGPWGSFVLAPHVIQPDFTGKGRDITTQRVIYGTEQRVDSGKKRDPSPFHIESFLGAFEDVRADNKLAPKVSPIRLDDLETRFKELVRNCKGSPEQAWASIIKFMKENERVTISVLSSETFIKEA